MLLCTCELIKQRCLAAVLIADECKRQQLVVRQGVSVLVRMKQTVLTQTWVSGFFFERGVVRVFRLPENGFFNFFNFNALCVCLA